MTPDDGPEARARDAQIWAATRQAFGTGQPGLDRARRDLGLPSTTHPWDEYDRAARVLLLTSRHFEYPYELPERTLFAGPVLDDPAWATEQDWVPQGDPSEPLVLVSLGSSFQDQLGVYQRVISALGSLPIRGVVTLGDVFDGGDLNVPDNVDVAASVPHGPILERAAAMVTHGGHGSVLKSLAAGVPIVCLPLGRDQGENAAHIEWHGAGVRVNPTDAPDKIAAALSHVLSEPSFKSVAVRLRTKIQSEIAEDIATRELELVARNTPVATEA